jgi:type I restriction enzyme R subunit
MKIKKIKTGITSFLFSSLTASKRTDISEGKNNGLIVDYCGILKSLRQALATFGGSTGGEDDGEADPVRPNEELLQDLSAAIGLVKEYLVEKGGDLSAVATSAGFQRIAAIENLKNLINENDETRKRFEVMAREVFNKFKASLTIKGVNGYRADVAAINIIYKSLQEDRDAADISGILRELHAIIEPAIVTKGESADGGRIYDISAIDFDRLRKEFEKSPKKQTEVHNLKDAIEKRLARLLAENPLRTNFQQHYEKIVADYNSEKDRATIEATFEALMRLVGDLDVESTRAMREGLDEETLALFDLLKKPDLEKKDIGRIKKVAVELFAILKRKKQEIDDWRAKEQTRDEMRQAIHDFLYSDTTGLPESYKEPEVDAKAEAVFEHVYRMNA